MNYNEYMTLKELGIEMDRAYNGAWDENYDNTDEYYGFDVYDME